MLKSELDNFYGKDNWTPYFIGTVLFYKNFDLGRLFYIKTNGTIYTLQT